MPSLSTLPEELVSDIFAYALFPSPHPHRAAALRACRALYRIGTPHLYRTVPLRTPHAANALARTLAVRPDLAIHIRELYAAAAWLCLADILPALGTLDLLDLTLNADRSPGSAEPLAAALASPALDVRTLVLRKGPAYLTQPRVATLVDGLAVAVPAWPSLTSVTFALRLAHPASSAHQSAVARLTAAFGAHPALRTVRALVPQTWSPALLVVAANPALRRVVLLSAEPAWAIDAPDGAGASVEGKCWEMGLWWREARKHARLVALVEAGSMEHAPVSRMRSQTLNVAHPQYRCPLPAADDVPGCCEHKAPQDAAPGRARSATMGH